MRTIYYQKIGRRYVPTGYTAEGVSKLERLARLPKEIDICSQFACDDQRWIVEQMVKSQCVADFDRLTVTMVGTDEPKKKAR
jgi:hypothetical protein